MSRNYGRFTTDIWDDPRFRALSAAAQRAYFMLGTQADITAAGTLALRLRRWSRYASDTPSDALSDALSELAERRFLVLDYDTEELLVRSFIQWDGGIHNEKRRPVVLEAASEAESPAIRAVLASELRQLGVDDATCDALSDGPSDATTGFDRVVVTKGEYVPQPTTPSPQPATPLPQPATPLPQPATRGPLANGDTAQTLVADWLDQCKRRPPTAVIGQTAKAIRQMLAEGIDPDDIRCGVKAWMDKGLHPSALASVVNEVMNSQPKQTTSERNYERTSQLVDHFRGQEEAAARKAIS